MLFVRDKQKLFIRGARRTNSSTRALKKGMIKKEREGGNLMNRAGITGMIIARKRAAPYSYDGNPVCSVPAAESRAPLFCNLINPPSRPVNNSAT